MTSFTFSRMMRLPVSFARLSASHEMELRTPRSTRTSKSWNSSSFAAIRMQGRMSPSAKREVNELPMAPGSTAPVSVTWVSPPIQPSSLAVHVERRDEHLVRRVAAADERIVVEEVVALAEPDLRFVVVGDHPFDRTRHRVDMDHQAGRQADRVAFWGV